MARAKQYLEMQLVKGVVRKIKRQKEKIRGSKKAAESREGNYDGHSFQLAAPPKHLVTTNMASVWYRITSVVLRENVCA